MDLKDVIKFQLKRANPFPGLMIDVDTWQDAHNYHRDQQRLHIMAFHQTGILGGLEVNANNPPDLSVTIRPGMAIDPNGNSIIVAEPQRYTLKTRQKGTIYLVIQFREVPTGPYQPPDGGQPTRIVEGYRIQERESLPKEAHLELARIEFDPADPAIKDPQKPTKPGINEIDYRYRRAAASATPVQPPVEPPPPPPPAKAARAAAPEPARTVAPPPPVQEVVAPPSKETVTIGYAVLGEAPKGLHLLGLQNLSREISRQYDFTLEIKENVALDKAIKCQLLYLAGNGRFELSEAEKASVGDFLKKGGCVVAEGCSEMGDDAASKGSKEFGLAFNQLASQLNCKLENVRREHPLLSAVHVFSGAPSGAETGMLLEGGHMIYSGSDYGCAWAGGHQNDPLPRETIRSSVEMGVNVAAYAGMTSTKSR